MSQQESAKTQAKEKILEALFEYAAACHVESISTAKPFKDPSEPYFQPSPEFENKMKKFFSRQNRKNKLIDLKNRTLRFLPKAAIILLIIYAGPGSQYQSVFL